MTGVNEVLDSEVRNEKNLYSCQFTRSFLITNIYLVFFHCNVLNSVLFFCNWYHEAKLLSMLLTHDKQINSKDL